MVRARLRTLLPWSVVWWWFGRQGKSEAVVQDALSHEGCYGF